MPYPLTRVVRIVVFVAVTVGAVAIAALGERLPQDPEYHRFADTRTLLSVPNGCDVLSNLGFLVVGAWGLAVARRRSSFADPRERWPWLVMFAGVALTSAGSAWYHLEPTNASLLWDRLPMTLGFMGLFSALVGERVSVRAGVALLGPLVLVGLASVVYWAVTEERGAGDLRPYLVVQVYPLATILLLLALFPARYTRGADLLVGLGWYVAAKLVERHDRGIFELLGVVSGHTLKHVFAAVGAGWLVWMLAVRRPLRPPSQGVGGSGRLPPRRSTTSGCVEQGVACATSREDGPAAS